ncbi:MAG: bacteriorhodopsin [Bacteroidota bacterium]
MTNTLLSAVLEGTDYIGVTFFIGSMAMVASALFFLMEYTRVSGKWKLSLLISGLITAIAGIHYFYMRDQYLETGDSPIAIRYIDWLLTVPLMCVEFYLLMRHAGAKKGFMFRLILWSFLMLLFGFIGEAVDPDNTVLWGVLSTVGYVGVLYEVLMGEGKKAANNSDDEIANLGYKILTWFIIVGWAIYPIGYMTMDGNLLSSVLDPSSMDIIYNIGDAVNKIGFGLVVYYVATTSSVGSKSKGGIE